MTAQVTAGCVEDFMFDRINKFLCLRALCDVYHIGHNGHESKINVPEV